MPCTDDLLAEILRSLVISFGKQDKVIYSQATSQLDSKCYNVTA
jgi:hypothetical protein